MSKVQLCSHNLTEFRMYRCSKSIRNSADSTENDLDVHLEKGICRELCKHYFFFRPPKQLLKLMGKQIFTILGSKILLI